MADLILRTIVRPGDTTKNAPLTNGEVDTNFINLDADIGTRALLNSPAFVGIPTAPTATSGDNSTQIATTAFVKSSITVTGNGVFSGTGSITVPVGTTIQRPVTPTNGMIRYNETLNIFEGYKNNAWGAIGGGATGSGGNSTFWENDTTITADYTVTLGKNAGTFGPITIADGVVIDVPVSSNWTIV